jgi:hypothetical protein
MHSFMKPSTLHTLLLKGRNNHTMLCTANRSNKDSRPTLVQNNFLRIGSWTASDQNISSQ